MAKTSVFELTCLCGTALVSEEREFSCPTCGQKIWIDWSSLESDAGDKLDPCNGKSAATPTILSTSQPRP
jgi:hypothetical protein